jgi:hypothetical protein
MVEPATAVTEPKAVAKLPPGNDRPDGGRNVPPPGLVPPVVPPVPPGRPPPKPPPAPPPKPPREQDPDTGWLIETVVAVTGPPKTDLVDDAVVGLPIAVMHEPTVTADSEVVVICRMTVADV